MDTAFRVISAAGIGLTVLAMAGHYYLVGPKHPELARERATVVRFNWLECIVRWALGLTFIALAVTGFAPRVIFDTALSHYILMAHVSASGMFAVSVAALAVLLAKDCAFRKHDWLWFFKLGGMYGKKEDIPAGRFDAGAKLAFWTLSCTTIVVILSAILPMYPIFSQHGLEIMLQIHRYATLLLVLVMIKYVYFNLIAKPGALAALFSGRVGPGWARRHHSLWWEQLENEKAQAAGQADQPKSEE